LLGNALLKRDIADEVCTGGEICRMLTRNLEIVVSRETTDWHEVEAFVVPQITLTVGRRQMPCKMIRMRIVLQVDSSD
jgi:hypothetical protein